MYCLFLTLVHHVNHLVFNTPFTIHFIYYHHSNQLFHLYKSLPFTTNFTNYFSFHLLSLFTLKIYCLELFIFATLESSFKSQADLEVIIYYLYQLQSSKFICLSLEIKLVVIHFTFNNYFFYFHQKKHQQMNHF